MSSTTQQLDELMDGLKMDLSQQRIIHDEHHARAMRVASDLLAAAGTNPDTQAEAKQLQRRYFEVQKRLRQLVTGHADDRSYLGGATAAGGLLGIMALTQVALSLPAAVFLLALGVAGVIGTVTLGHFWKSNDRTSLDALYRSFPSDTGAKQLAFMAFKRREHQAAYRSFRPILDKFMKEDERPEDPG